MFHRQQEIARKLVYAQRFGLAPEMIGQLQMMSQAIDLERRERNFSEVWNMLQSLFPEVIETDPDLRAAEPAAQLRAAEDKASKPNRPRQLNGLRRPVPTAVPVAPPPEPPQNQIPRNDTPPKDEV